MSVARRRFISLSAAATSGFLFGMGNFARANQPSPKNLAGDIVPISLEERLARIAKAQSLMLENRIGAVVLDCGTTLNYFTGVRWWPSERTMVAVIPARGAVTYICPAFEESRLREQLIIGQDVYTWQEDESPYSLIAKAIKDSGVPSGLIGMEEQVRFFIADGLRKAAPQFQLVSADPVTVPCRMIKSAAEIALMLKASEITLAAIKIGVSQLREGMLPNELAAIINKAQRDLGGVPDFALCLFGEASAFPHGTKVPVKLRKGDMVLMDVGCTVEGYCSDITRTVVFGAEPTPRQREIWNLEKQAQAAGFAAAKLGAPCEKVDAAARKVITDAGFGPNYKVPGLPHRTGHGIGMDGHEWGNMVRGNKKLLEPGMCFSIEPTIAIPGEFGVRFEDCVYMTSSGPKWFSEPVNTIEAPFG